MDFLNELGNLKKNCKFFANFKNNLRVKAILTLLCKTL